MKAIKFKSPNVPTFVISKVPRLFLSFSKDMPPRVRYCFRSSTSMHLRSLYNSKGRKYTHQLKFSAHASILQRRDKRWRRRQFLSKFLYARTAGDNKAQSIKFRQPRSSKIDSQIFFFNFFFYLFIFFWCDSKTRQCDNTRQYAIVR